MSPRDCYSNATPIFAVAGTLLLAVVASSQDTRHTRQYATNELASPSDLHCEEVERPDDFENGLTLSSAESLALANNPTIAAAAARVQAARGNRWQVGLPPNPTLGYVGSEIGNDGAAGQQGIYVGQEFVRGGKLQLNRQVADREVARLEQQLAAQQQRVLTDVRATFYRVHFAARRVNLATRLVELGRSAAETAASLLQAGEGKKSDVLQAEIELQRSIVDLEQARAIHAAAWRQLSAVIGVASLTATHAVAGEIALIRDLQWDESLSQLLATSPEINAAVAAVEQAAWAVQRASAEPIPNVNAQVAVQYDDATDYTLTSVQIGLPLPLWNRNQGGVAQARGQLLAAQRQVRAVQLRLQRRLAEVFAQYQSSRIQVLKLEEAMLPRAVESLELVRTAYQAGEVDFLDLLTAQRTYFEVSLQHLDALQRLNDNLQLINGLLLDDSLASKE